MSAVGRAIGVVVRALSYDSPRPLDLGAIVTYKDGLGIITSRKAPFSTGPWLHTLLYLSGEEYSGDRNTAIRLLALAAARWAQDPRDELHVSVSVY